MADTRPPSDAAAIKRIVEDEYRFRTEVLVALAEVKLEVSGVKDEVGGLKDTLKDHVDSDNERFGQVNLNIGKGDTKLAWIVGIGTGALGVAGVAMWIIGRAT